MNNKRLRHVVRIRRLREQGHARLLAEANAAVDEARSELDVAEHAKRHAQAVVERWPGPTAEVALHPDELRNELELGRDALRFFRQLAAERDRRSASVETAEERHAGAQRVFREAVRARLRLDHLLERNEADHKREESVAEENSMEEVAELLGHPNQAGKSY